MSLKISNKQILLVGGGAIAHFKYQKITDYNPKKLIVVAKKFDEEFKQNIPSFAEQLERPFEMSDLDTADIVIVAVEDLDLQQIIYNECQRRKILCNCVDELDRCDFIFPSTIKRGDVVIAVSSSGKVPGFSASLKEYIDQFIPQNIEKKLLEISELRKSLPSGKARMQRIREESRIYFNKIL
jgi:precorrin-2 dehydrogenase/sirohydrochlorin ferrochelatase